MIQLVSGVCRVGNKLMRPTDKPFSITKEEEEYLVKQGVAKYVTEEEPAEDVATPSVATDDVATGVNSADGKNGAGGDDDGAANDAPVANIVDGHFVKEDLMKLTRDKLNALAADLGIDGENCANKGEVADLICAIEIGGDDDGDQMPSLTPGDPVV